MMCIRRSTVCIFNNIPLLLSSQKLRARNAELERKLADDQARVVALESQLGTCAARDREIKDLRAENEYLRKERDEDWYNWRVMRISSPLTKVRFGAACGNYPTPLESGCDDFNPGDGTSVAWTADIALPLPSIPKGARPREDACSRWWPIWCPCCRRPLELTCYSSEEYWGRHWPEEHWEQDRGTHSHDHDNLEMRAGDVSQPQSSGLDTAEPGVPDAEPTKAPRYAYAAAIWGHDTGFVLGALALGAGLRASKTTLDLVLLHTDDVPNSSLDLLSKVWILHKVDLLEANEALFNMWGSRFDGVFTKLHVLRLTEYTKILLLDLDIAVMSCPDELFALKAPAAMHRGIMGSPHNTPIDGRTFFVGEPQGTESDWQTWGQAGGINAGVMLLMPDKGLYERIMCELVMPSHPGHIKGSGPEQDYLSRLFAPWWTHIGVAFNFQLHRIFHALDHALKSLPALGAGNERLADDQIERWLPERLAIDLDSIKLIHFSGEVKMWDKDPLDDESHTAIADRVLRDCAGDCNCRLWLDRTADISEYQALGLQLVDGGFAHSDPAVGAQADEIIRSAVEMARGAADRAAEKWRISCLKLPSLFPLLPTVPTIIEQVRQPRGIEGAIFPLRARVEYWRGGWYPATVVATHSDLTVSVVFDSCDWWGSGARHVSSECLRAAAQADNDISAIL